MSREMRYGEHIYTLGEDGDTILVCLFCVRLNGWRRSKMGSLSFCRKVLEYPGSYYETTVKMAKKFLDFFTKPQHPVELY